MDNPPDDLVSADDHCPSCAVAMPEPRESEFAGIWDGNLGNGFGNWYVSRCAACGASLVGWQYVADTATSHVRWECRRG